MTDDELETQLRETLRSGDLPAAPESLRRTLADLPVPEPGRRGRRRGLILFAAAALVLAGLGAGSLLGGALPRRSVDPAPPSDPTDAVVAPQASDVAPTKTPEALPVPAGFAAFEAPGIRFAHPADWERSDAYDNVPFVLGQRIVATFARGVTLCPNTEGVTPVPTKPPGGCSDLPTEPGSLVVSLQKFPHQLPPTADRYGDPARIATYQAWRQEPWNDTDDPVNMQWSVAGPDDAIYGFSVSAPRADIDAVRTEVEATLGTLQLWSAEPPPKIENGMIHVETGQGFSFDYPAGWSIYYPQDWWMTGASIVTVASGPLEPPCDGDSCPRFTTPPGTIAIEFSSGSGPNEPDWTKATETVGGQPAFIDHWGDEMVDGADQGKSWKVRLDDERRVLSIDASLRAPALPGQLDALNAIVDSVSIDTLPVASPTPAAADTPAPTAPPTLPPADVALPYPEGCPAYGLSSRRCAGIVAWALTEAGVPADSATVELLGDPGCGPGCVVTRTTSFIVRIRVTPTAGAPSDHPVFCGVGGTFPLCLDAPEIRIYTTHDGYSDIPCPDDPNGQPACPSPVPSIDPGAAASAEPLRIPSLTIPIDRTGAYAIDLGDAVLPNGVLDETGATLANDKRFDVVLTDGYIAFKITGDDGMPLRNKYEQGWRPGTQRVHAQLVFTVESFDPGATLEITDIVVR